MKNEGYVGRRFGKWLVTDATRAMIAGRERNALMCECDCGQRQFILPAALRLKQTTQCRTCSNRQKALMKSRLTHGGSDTLLYRIWQSMKARCTKEYSGDFHRYGARGITVCDAWQNFATFRCWAESSGYRQGLTIDRRDNDRGYEPDNCRWIDRKAQNRNRRNNKRYAFRGENLMISEIAERTGVSRSMIYLRVTRYGFDIERAVAQPARGHPHHPTHRR